MWTEGSHSEQNGAGPRRGTQTAARALQLLRAVVESPAPVTLTELQRITGLNKGAVHRLMAELEEQLFVTRDPETRRYVVGSGLVALSARVFRGINIRDAARPVMAAIREATGETVSLHVRHLQHRICIESLASPQPVKRVVPLGEMLPLFAGPTGKAMLAFLPAPEAEAILDWAGAEGQDVPAIRGQLDAIRRDGHLIALGDRTPNVGAMSVPIFTVDGIAASITVSGPGDRFQPEAIEALADEVDAQCARLSAALGHVTTEGARG